MKKSKPAASSRPKASKSRSRRTVSRLRRPRGRFSRAELVRFERALLAEKQRMLRQGSFTNEVMETPEASGDLSQHRSHIADQGTENYQREMASRFKSIESQTLREISEALARIAAGTYGTCARCGAPIPRARLEVVPHARLCMKCLRSQH